MGWLIDSTSYHMLWVAAAFFGATTLWIMLA